MDLDLRPGDRSPAAIVSIIHREHLEKLKLSQREYEAMSQWLTMQGRQPSYREGNLVVAGCVLSVRGRL